MKRGICQLCKYTLTEFETCPSKGADTCQRSPTLTKEWDRFDDGLKAGLALSGLDIHDTDEIASGISHFKDRAAAVEFAEREIERYTRSNFARAWFFERVKKIASGDLTPIVFGKSPAQKVAEKLGIAYLQV